ncbi:MAG: HD domain-containing protein [Vicinamibacterales bacterium]
MSTRAERTAPPETPAADTRAIIDMGASALRLVVADVGRDGAPRILEEAVRGVPLGRDTFSRGVIGSSTMESALAALEGFQAIASGYRAASFRAVATSAVREARNSDTFLDRIRIRTGLEFEVISESEESRLVYLSVREALRHHASMQAVRSLIVEVGGGVAGLTLVTVGYPRQSGVYALGAIRMAQELGLARQAHDQRLALLKRHIDNVVGEIRDEIMLRNSEWFIAVGGDARFAASQLVEQDDKGVRVVTRDAFIAFCDAIESESEERLSERFRLPAVEAETLVPAMMVYRALLTETVAPLVVVPIASLRSGLLLDLSPDRGMNGRHDLERQVLASAEALGRRYRYDEAHGRAVMRLAVRLFEELRDEHGLGDHERLLLQVAALLHDIGNFVSLRSHHKHTQYLLSASQIFGLSDDDLAIVSNVARYHRRALPQKTHLPYIALDRPERTVVNKLAALLRLANALDAEHLQKVRDLKLRRHDDAWVLHLDGTGDLSMERVAAQARADMFSEVFGHRMTVRGAGVYS